MTSAIATVWKKSRRWLPGVFISLVAFFFVARVTQWQELGPALRRFSLGYIGVMVLLTLVFLLIRAGVSRVLLSGRPKLSEAFWAINQGYLLNNILPFRLGEIGRAVLLGQQTNLPAAQILSSIIIERALDIAIAATMLLSTLPLALEMTWAKPVAIIMLAVVAAGMASLFLMARHHLKVSAWVDKLGIRWKFVGKWVAPQVRSLLTGLTALTDLRQFILALLLLLASWAIAIGVYYVGLLAIAPTVPIWWGVFTDAVLALGIAIPSAPAALGTFEAATVGALTILGIDQTTGLAYAITLHFMQILVTGALGLVGLMRQGRSISSLFLDLQNRKSAA
ncbi:MAG: lysylphosphatidylglycerol synthase transmembrane domain-containing protein [Bellilinea sp.]